MHLWITLAFLLYFQILTEYKNQFLLLIQSLNMSNYKWHFGIYKSIKQTPKEKYNSATTTLSSERLQVSRINVYD